MKRKKTMKMSTWNNVVGWAFVLPAVAGFLILNLLPMLLSGYYSLCDYNIIGEPEWVGIKNYAELLSGKEKTFWLSAKATALYAIMAVPANLIFAFMIALMLNCDMKGRAFFRSLFYLPCILPAVATSFVWILLMNPDFGLFNAILEALHLPKSQFFWGKESVLPSIVFMGDGGNSWHKFWKVTLPMVSSTLFFNLVMGIINALQVFSQAYIITEGGPNNASLFYVYNLWRQAFKYMDMGKASAMAWILFVVVLVLTAGVFRSSKKWVYYEGGEEA